MSEVKNSITDIDNNVQEESPKPTPKKRMSRAEKARIESEELLKALGVTIESGRQTRSCRRSTVVVESPKPEPAKRKQPSTPRTSKKAKVVEVDQTDGPNHVDESNKNETQIVEASTTNSVETVKVTEPVKAVVSESEREMEVDTPIGSTQPEAKTQPESVPQPETIEDSPMEESPIDDEPPIEEDSLPTAADEVEIVTPSTAIEVTEVLDIEDVSATADTTTTTVVINESETIIISPPESNKDKDEPIELQSSPSDIDQQEDTVTNSQAIAEPDAIVELESSSNESDAKADGVNNSQELNSLELEAINSDSSLGVSEIQDEQPSSGTDAAVQEKPLPTSTAADVKITDVAASVAKTNENSVHSSERPQNAVESTNNQKPIGFPDNFRTTITVDNPIEEPITTTSETLLEPSATTA